MNRFFSLAGSLTLSTLAILAFQGCSQSSTNPKTYPVTGTVTYNGKAVEGATVILVPTEKQQPSAAANTDSAGKFEMTTFAAKDGAVPGTFKVKVTKFDRPPTEPDKQVKNMSYEEEQRLYDPNAKQAAPPKNLLPKKYESEHSSGITHTVSNAPTKLDIEIKDK